MGHQEAGNLQNWWRRVRRSSLAKRGIAGWELAVAGHDRKCVPVSPIMMQDPGNSSWQGTYLGGGGSRVPLGEPRGQSQESRPGSAVICVDLCQVTVYLCLSFLICRMQKLDHIGVPQWRWAGGGMPSPREMVCKLCVLVEGSTESLGE